MLFVTKIKQLREESGLPQRKIAAVLDIDTATYCKIEKGDRHARREQVLILADLFHTDADELLKLWLADRVYSVIAEEDNANEVLNMVCESFQEYGKTANT